MTTPQTTAPPEQTAITDQAVAWFIRLSAPTVGPTDQQQFKAWCESDPRHQQAYQQVATLWGSDAFSQALQAHTPQGRQRRTPQDRPAPAPKPRRWAIRWAPPLLAASLAGFLVAAQACGLSPGQALTKQWQDALADYSTGTNQSQTVTLADGSKITLAAQTALDVTQGPQGTAITLLHGKALFDVHPVAPGQQFTVATDHAQVRVIGTAFTVETAPEGSEVAVVHGRVEVKATKASAQTLLGKGQGAAATDQGRLTALPYPEDALAWTEGRLQFHGQTLGQVAQALDAHYPGLIVIPDHALRSEKVSGSYRLDDPQGVLTALAEIVGAQVTPLPGKILFVRYQ
jgi:transmembrane sensor